MLVFDTQVVHFLTAPVVCYPPALDSTTCSVVICWGGLQGSHHADRPLGTSHERPPQPAVHHARLCRPRRECST